MRFIGEIWPNLENLTIVGGADLTRDRTPAYALAQDSVDLSLAELTVQDKGEEEGSRKTKALRDVQRFLPCIGGFCLRKLVNPGTRISDSDLTVLATACPLLEHLEVQSSRGVTDVGLRALSRCSLSTFVLDDWDAQFNNVETVTDVGVCSLVTGPRGAPLTTLKLRTYFSANVAERILLVLAESAVNLRTMALGHCDNLGLSPALFDSLSGLFRRLQDMDFGNVFDNSVNDEELGLLANSAVNVTRLRVALGTQVTQAGLAWLGQLPQLREVILVSGWEQASAVDVLQALKPLQGQLTTLWLRTSSLARTLAEVRQWPALEHLHLVYDGELEMLEVDNNALTGLHQRPITSLLVPDTDMEGDFDAGLASPGSWAWLTPSPVGSMRPLFDRGHGAGDHHIEPPRLGPLAEEDPPGRDNERRPDTDWVAGVRVRSETSPTNQAGPSTPARLLAGRVAPPTPPKRGAGSSDDSGRGSDGSARSAWDVGRKEGDWPVLRQFALITTHVGLVDLRCLEGAEKVEEVEIMLGTGLYLTEEVVRGYFHLLSSLPHLAKLRLNMYSDGDWFAEALGDAVCGWKSLRELRLAMTWRGPPVLFDRLLQSQSLQLVDARFGSRDVELQFYVKLLSH